MNLFLISQFGQLIHHQALIKRDGLKNNKLVILYTKANIEVPRKIKKEADNSLFDEIYLAELPIKPNSLNLDNINKITTIYSQVLQGISDLYMSSFESHYNICHKIAKKENIKTHLIEEGLATYKYSYSKFEKVRPSKKNSFIKALNDSGLSSNKYYPFAKIIYTYLRDFYKLPIQVVKAFRYNKESEYKTYNYLEKLSDERRGFIDYAKDFDSINVAYPRAIDGVFSAGQVNVLNTYATYEPGFDLDGLVEKYSVSFDDMLYLSQMYPIPSEAYADAVINVIQEYLSDSSGKCFIKFHPRDKQDFIEFIKAKVVEMELSERVLVIEESDFPIEALIKKCQFDKILGISTTALVYANQLSQSTDCVSITNGLIQALGSKCPAKARQVILEHTKMLTIFEHIDFN